MVAPHVNLYKRQNGNNRKPGRNGDRWLNSSKTGKTTLSYMGFSKANPSHDQFNTKGKKKWHQRKGRWKTEAERFPRVVT